ncbi:MAG: VirB8/TrbF family protein [Hyphomonadaceae bacterium]
MTGRHRAALKRSTPWRKQTIRSRRSESRQSRSRVLSVVRASPTSFNLRWRESTYVSGTLTHVERFSGVATIVIEPPSSPERLSKNPLGLYVHSLTWSRDLQQ